VMMAFRAGRSTLMSHIFRPRIDRILFAATKADHLHHASHDRLETILNLLVTRALARAQNVGAKVDVLAIAAVRATREASVKHDGETLDAIVGVPAKGETINGEVFDGHAEVAIFPGELPTDPRVVFQGEGIAQPEENSAWRFARFRPPLLKPAADGGVGALPHIRLDRAIEFLIGDKLL